MTRPLQPDDTIADVLATLDKPDDYVAAVFGRMNSVRRSLGGTIVVKIGVTGKGIMPNYRVDRSGEGDHSMSAFDGQTHHPFTDVRNVDTENWSTRSMTFDEVKALLGRIRGYEARA